MTAVPESAPRSSSAVSSVGADAPEVPTREAVGFVRVVGELFRVVFAGWFRVVARGLGVASRLLRARGWPPTAFAAACLAAMFASLAPWVQYEIDLLQREAVRLGSDGRPWFFLPGALGLLFVVFGAPYRTLLYYVSGLAAAVWYAIGFGLPDLVHADLASYEFTFWIWIYGGALLVGLLLARAALATPFFPAKSVRGFFLEEPAARPVPAFDPDR